MFKFRNLKVYFVNNESIGGWFILGVEDRNKKL